MEKIETLRTAYETATELRVTINRWQKVVTFNNLSGNQKEAHEASKILCKLEELQFQLQELEKLSLSNALKKALGNS